MDEKERRKLRKELRKQKKAKETERAMKVEIREDCIVCGKIIGFADYRRLSPDEKVPEWRYYHLDTCGPGTEAWYKFHPSRAAMIMLEANGIQKERRVERRERRRRRILISPMQGENKNIQPILEKEETTMATKEKGKKGEHLKPMKPVTVPAVVLKKQPKEVRELVEALGRIERSSKDAAKIRKSLRKLGFKLSEFREGGNETSPPPEAPKKAKKGKKEGATPPPPEELKE